MGKIGYYIQKNKTRPHLTSFPKINLKWIKDVNVRSKIIKLLEENTGEKLLDVGFSNDLFGYDTKSTDQKPKINR